MKKWLKVLIGVVASLVIIIVIGGFIFYRMLSSSLPEYEGEISSNKISSDIKIYRDSLAIPYIIANTKEDAAFAIGYLHAQERMFQMDIIRRAGEGRLSEIFGEKTLPFDKMFLTVGIRRDVEKFISRINPEAKKLLIAYSNGVNKYINEAKGNYPVEFDILDYEPYPWKPEHSLMVVRMMAWELNISWWSDIAFAHLIQKLGLEKVKPILPVYPENAPTIIPPELRSVKNIPDGLVQVDRAFRKFIGSGGTHIGSNNWVVNGKLSESGKPLIANDPHLSYSAPGKWYAAVIRSNDWNCEGVTLPGVPGVVIGKNKNIAWALTNVMADDADFYTEKLDSSGTKYFYNGTWHDLEIIKDEIKVKNQLPVKYEIKLTHRGPIISNIHLYSLMYSGNDTSNSNISMRWMGNEFSDETYAYLLLNQAQNWNEFKTALSYYSVPGQNFVYGDSAGNIGYVFGCRLPKRSNEGISFIYDGTTDKYDWKGFVDQHEVPTIFNPASGFIASANNKTLKGFPYHISNIWEPPSRYERIVELLSGKKKHSVKDYMKYQNDVISPYAKKITAYILNAFSDVKIEDGNLLLALGLFKEWNFEMDKFSQVPTIYAYFFKHLLNNIFLDEMGNDLFNEFVFLANIPYRVVPQLLSDPYNQWFDDISTGETETRDDILRKSLVNALDELEQNYGDDLKSWQWGNIHKAIFKHAFSGASSLIDGYINIGPFSVGGDGTTIFNTEYPFHQTTNKNVHSRHEPFENTLGPSMRFIYDFAKPDEFYLVLTTGQSGNLMSEHYDDMAEMWLMGDYIKVRTDMKSISNPANQLFTIKKK